ncbi:MAG: type II toxin-antitoxin system RelE/ParE family toxin [Acidobacteriota bacterium]
MAGLRWTAEAESSLREIYNHIAQNRPATARRTLESILNKAESLREAPRLGQAYRHSSRHGVRILTYGQFQIAFLQRDDAIIILGVFHGLIFLPLQ